MRSEVSWEWDSVNWSTPSLFPQDEAAGPVLLCPARLLRAVILPQRFEAEAIDAHARCPWLECNPNNRQEFIVPNPMRRTASDQMMVQLVEADVEIGFGLVDEAKAYRARGQVEFGTRALKEAEGIVVDIEQRLQRLGDAEAGPFHALVAELRNEIGIAGKGEG